MSQRKAMSEDGAFIDLMKDTPGLRISGTSCMAEEPYTNLQNLYGDSKPEGQNLETAAAFPNLQTVVGAGDMKPSSQIMNMAHPQQQTQLVSQTKLNSDIFPRLLSSPASSSSHAAQIADQFLVNMDPHSQKPNTSENAVEMRIVSNSDHSRRPHQYTSFNNEISIADLSYRDPGRLQRPSSSQERPYPSRQLTHSGISFTPADFRDSIAIPTLQGTPPPSAYSMFLNVAESQSYIGRQTGLSGFQPQQKFAGKAPCNAMSPREVSESIGALLQKPFESGAAPSVTVVKEGRAIGRGVCLQDYDSYEGLARALRDMFGSEATLDSSSCESPCGLEPAVPGYEVAYEDSEGDLLLAGDLSWKDFVRAAKRIRLLPTSSSKPNVIGSPSEMANS